MTVKANHITLITIGSVILVGLIAQNKSLRKFQQIEQVSNRLKEFFDEPDLSKARLEYHSLAVTLDPEFAFQVVVSKGGFYDD